MYTNRRHKVSKMKCCHSLRNQRTTVAILTAINPLWGYDDTCQDSLRVADWMLREDLTPLYNSTDPGTYDRQGGIVRTRQVYASSRKTRMKISRGFLNSQNRPIIVEIGLKIPLIRKDGKNRCNLNKVDWDKYLEIIERTVLRIPSQQSCYERFVGLIISAARQSTPRGRRATFIRGGLTTVNICWVNFKESRTSTLGKFYCEGSIIAERMSGKRKWTFSLAWR